MTRGDFPITSLTPNYLYIYQESELRGFALEDLPVNSKKTIQEGISKKSRIFKKNNNMTTKKSVTLPEYETHVPGPWLLNFFAQPPEENENQRQQMCVVEKKLI